MAFSGYTLSHVVLLSFSGSCFGGQLWHYQSHMKTQHKKTSGKERAVFFSGRPMTPQQSFQEESRIEQIEI